MRTPSGCSEPTPLLVRKADAVDYRQMARRVRVTRRSGFEQGEEFFQSDEFQTVARPQRRHFFSEPIRCALFTGRLCGISGNSVANSGWI
jgi:hypothetical protein